VAWAETHLRTRWHLDTSSRLATIDMDRKVGAAVPFFRWSSVPILHKVAWAEAYLRTKWHLDPSSRLATIDMGLKLGDCVAFGRICAHFGGAGSPSNTMSPGPRPTSIPSDILIHPTVWLRHGPKSGDPVSFLGELCPHLAQCGVGRGLPPCQVSS